MSYGKTFIEIDLESYADEIITPIDLNDLNKYSLMSLACPANEDGHCLLVCKNCSPSNCVPLHWQCSSRFVLSA